jgi:glyoxylase I family protein
MEVTGIGGFFFRAKDPKALGRWYQQHLGISLTPSSYADSVWQQEAGPTVFDPQPETSDLFKGTDKVWKKVSFWEVRGSKPFGKIVGTSGIGWSQKRSTYPSGYCGLLFFATF